MHCIVPGGGISPDGKHWIACKSGFFLPVRVLSRLFRRLFLQGLQAMHAGRELQFFTYLVRYTHRVAIANSRLLDLDETHVSFRWKDYRESGLHKSKVMRINVGEFMRRFLLHVLPNGFHRIRHYGLFANGHRADKLALCRSLLDLPATPTDRYNDDDNGPTASNDESPPCPCCGGRMKIIEIFDGPLSRPYHARKLDGL